MRLINKDVVSHEIKEYKSRCDQYQKLIDDLEIMNKRLRLQLNEYKSYNDLVMQYYRQRKN